MKCKYCNNIVNDKSPLSKEGICKVCADLDRIGNKMQVQLGRECLEKVRLQNEKIQV